MATSVPSSCACRSARGSFRGGRCSAVLHFSTEVPCCGHARPGQQANDRHRPGGSLSLQPKPDLLGVLAATSGDRNLGQRPVAGSDPHRGACDHGLCRDPERGGVSRKEVRCRVLGLQELRAPLGVGS